MLFYNDKKNKECPLVEKLIKSGYQQERGGYIKYAYEHKSEVEVDYRNAEPNQWWHLIKSYCDRTNKDKNFPKSIKCGELIFWMAEVGECVEKKELENLVDNIIASGTPVNRKNDQKPKFKYDRKKWNEEIHNLCFDKIVKVVESKLFDHIEMT